MNKKLRYLLYHMKYHQKRDQVNFQILGIILKVKTAFQRKMFHQRIPHLSVLYHQKHFLTQYKDVQQAKKPKTTFFRDTLYVCIVYSVVPTQQYLQIQDNSQRIRLYKDDFKLFKYDDLKFKLSLLSWMQSLMIWKRKKEIYVKKIALHIQYYIQYYLVLYSCRGIISIRKQAE